MDYKNKKGSFIFMNKHYEVTTKFHSSGVKFVNYSYKILDINKGEIVLHGDNFNPSILCKTEETWPYKLGWRGIGELLQEVCDLPLTPDVSWLHHITTEQIDWLSEEDAEELKQIGGSIVESCINLTFQV